MAGLGSLQLTAQEVVTTNEEVQKVEFKDAKAAAKAIKAEERQTKKAAKVLKKQNQLEKTILTLEKKIAVDENKLKKYQLKHQQLTPSSDAVKKEKLELKIAKTERDLKTNKEKLSKARKKLL